MIGRLDERGRQSDIRCSVHLMPYTPTSNIEALTAAATHGILLRSACAAGVKAIVFLQQQTVVIDIEYDCRTALLPDTLKILPAI